MLGNCGGLLACVSVGEREYSTPRYAAVLYLDIVGVVLLEIRHELGENTIGTSSESESSSEYVEITGVGGLLLSCDGWK